MAWRLAIAGQRVDRRQPPGVRDAVRERSEGRAQARVADAVGIDGDQGALVLGLREVLREGGEPPVLAAHDDGREPGRTGERADEGDDERRPRSAAVTVSKGPSSSALRCDPPNGRTRSHKARWPGRAVPMGRRSRGLTQFGARPVPAAHRAGAGGHGPEVPIAGPAQPGCPSQAACAGAPVRGPARARRRRPGATPRTLLPSTAPGQVVADEPGTGAAGTEVLEPDPAGHAA